MADRVTDSVLIDLNGVSLDELIMETDESVLATALNRFLSAEDDNAAAFQASI